MIEAEQKLAVMRFRLPVSLRNEVKDYAERYGVNLSSFLRTAVLDLLIEKQGVDRKELYKEYRGKDNTFSFRVDSELKNKFQDECEKRNVASCEVLRRFMQDFAEGKE